MTSRALFFNLTKEELKSKIWLIALTNLIAFCVMPLAVAMELSNISTTLTAYDIRCARDFLNNISDGGFLFVCIIGGGIVIGFAMFSYLFSKKQVDTYHCIPVSRKLYFFVKLFSGFLIFFSAYLLHFIIMTAIGAGFGTPLLQLLPSVLYLFCLHLFGFLVSYLFAVICAILSGNLIVSGLLYALFVFLPIGIFFMALDYARKFFSTFIYQIANERYEKILRILQPHGNYIEKLSRYHFSDMEAIGISPGIFLYFPVVIALLLVIAFFLFKKHPSEAAGNALAFKKSIAPIRFVSTVLLSLVCGYVFGEMASYRHELPWTVFGLAFGLFVSFAIVNIIIHFDFKKALNKISQLGIAAAVVAIFFCCFCFDWFGYDKYLPEEEKLESVGIEIVNLPDYDKYWSFDTKYDYYISSNNDYYARAKQLNLDPAKYYDFIAELVANEGMVQEISAAEPIPIDTKAYNNNNLTTYVKYELKNGQTRYRSYTLSVTSENIHSVFALFDDPLYKESAYPILTQDDAALETVMVADSNLNQIHLTLSRAELVQFAELYKAAVRNHRAEAKATSLPVGQVLFGYSKAFSTERAGIIGYVYPEYTEVVNFLEAHGASFTIDAEKVNHISVNVEPDYTLIKEGISIYAAPTPIVTADTTAISSLTTEAVMPEAVASYAYENIQLSYNDPESIAALLEYAVPETYIPNSFLKPSLSNCRLNVTITLDDYGNQKTENYVIPSGKVPQFVLDDAQKAAGTENYYVSP